MKSGINQSTRAVDVLIGKRFTVVQVAMSSFKNQSAINCDADSSCTVDTKCDAAGILAWSGHEGVFELLLIPMIDGGNPRIHLREFDLAISMDSRAPT